MRNDLNTVQLIGHLGADPETTYTQSGTARTTLRLATNRTYTTSSGERRAETEWHRVILWGRLAEIAAEYLHTGAHAYLEGRLTTPT